MTYKHIYSKLNRGEILQVLWSQYTFDLFFNRFGGVQPMFYVIGIGELQSKVVFLDQVQRVKHLLVQVPRFRLFLKRF